MEQGQLPLLFPGRMERIPETGTPGAALPMGFILVELQVYDRIISRKCQILILSNERKKIFPFQKFFNYDEATFILN